MIEEKKVIFNTGFIFANEIEYAQSRGRKGLTTTIILTLLEPLIFVAHDKTVWLCSFSSKRAACVLRNSTKQTVNFEQSENRLIINWTHAFHNTVSYDISSDSYAFKFYFESFDDDQEIEWRVPLEIEKMIERLLNDTVSRD